jgi:lysyl-tRNA synthetase, class II
MQEENTNSYYEQRLNNIKFLRAKNINPYPHYFKRNNTIKELLTYNNTISSGEQNKDITVKTAGKIILKRCSSKKLLFYTMEDNSYCIQLIASLSFYNNNNTLSFDEINNIIHRGDIVGIEGFMGKSKKGELSIFLTDIQILTPSFHTLTKENFGIQDLDTRISNRYLDLQINKKTRDTFIARSRIISFIRTYLINKEFIEVETPILDIKHGGAAARPFVTFHNDLKQEMYMRIAPELRLKELIVGGLNKVFEIGKQFRNEGIDTTHNPEFTSIELYSAYDDYNILMKMTEDMLSNLVMTIKYSYKFTINSEKEINFEPPFQIIDMIPFLEDKIDIKFPDDMSSNEFNQLLIEYCQHNKISLPEPPTTAKLIDKLTEIYIEPLCWNPTFIINHPTIMSPLAKGHRNDNRLTERFELFVAGMELCNAYTELNDPIVQLERFKSQQKDKNKGDVEAHNIDYEFIKVLEHALPPTGGWGMGIDRLCMLLTDNIDSIKEVILFPTRNNKS